MPTILKDAVNSNLNVYADDTSLPDNNELLNINTCILINYYIYSKSII